MFVIFDNSRMQMLKCSKWPVWLSRMSFLLLGISMTLIKVKAEDDECPSTTKIVQAHTNVIEVLVGEQTTLSNVVQSRDSNNEQIDCDGQYEFQIVDGGVTLQRINKSNQLIFNTDDYVNETTQETVQFDVWLRNHENETKTTISKTVKYANPCSAATLTKKDFTFDDANYIINGPWIKSGCTSVEDLVEINTYDDCTYKIAWFLKSDNNIIWESDNSQALKAIKDGDSSNTHVEYWSYKDNFSYWLQTGIGPWRLRISYEVSLKNLPNVTPITVNDTFTVYTKETSECAVATIHQACFDDSEKNYKYSIDGSDSVTFDMKLTSSCEIEYICTCTPDCTSFCDSFSDPTTGICTCASDCTSFCDDFFYPATGIFEMQTNDPDTYKPGQYIVTLSGKVLANQDEIKIQEFKMKLQYPCSDTILSISPIADLDILVGEPQRDYQLTVTDSVSDLYGNRDASYCGGYEFYRQDSHSDVIDFDPILGSFNLQRSDEVVEVQEKTVTMRVKMKNYSIEKDVSFDLRVGMTCEESTLIIPRTSPLSDLSYLTKQIAVSLTWSSVNDLVQINAFDCGDYQLDWFMKKNGGAKQAIDTSTFTASETELSVETSDSTSSGSYEISYTIGLKDHQTVKKATSEADPLIVTITDICSEAKVAVSSQVDPADYLYKSTTTFTASFESICSIVYSCSMSGSVDLCSFFEQQTGQFSFATNSIQAYPPDDYAIEITGTVSGFTNSASHIFNLKIVDPLLELNLEKIQLIDSDYDNQEDYNSSLIDGDVEASLDNDSQAEQINQDENNDVSVSEQISGQPISRDELVNLMKDIFASLNASNANQNQVIGQLFQVKNFEESLQSSQSVSGDGKSTFDIFQFMKEYFRKYGIKERRESMPPLLYYIVMKNYFVLPMLESVDMSGNLLIKFSSEIMPSSFSELVYYLKQEKTLKDQNLKRYLQVDKTFASTSPYELSDEDSLSYIETILKGFNMMQIELASGSENDIEKKAFDWKLEQYDSQYMKLKIIFENPEYISMEETDTLKIVFDKIDYFIRPVSEKLHPVPQFFTIIVDMPLQSNSVMSEAQKKVITDQAKTFVFTNFGLQFALKNSLQIMFGSIISLQVLAHLPLANIQMPPNARQCFDIMVTVVSFDYFPISDIFDFGFTPSEPWSKAFTNLRYESLNFIDGMGSIILCIWIGIIFIITAIVFYRYEVTKRSRCCGKWFKKIFEPINVWYASLGFIFGVFFEVMVCVSVSYRIFESYEYLNKNDKFSIANQMVISLIMIIFIGFIFYFTWVKIPQLNALYLLKRRKELELYFMQTYKVDKEGLKTLQIAQSNKERLSLFMLKPHERLQKQALYRNKTEENWTLQKSKLEELTQGVTKSHLRIYKPLYSGLRQATRLSLMFTFFELIRRLTLLYVAMFMQELSYIQVIIFVLLSYISLIYLTLIMPYKSSYENYINLFNETITLFVSYHVKALIGISNSAEQFTQIGAFIAWTLYLCWSINIAIILTISLIQLRNSIRKCYKKHCKKQVPEQEQKIKAPNRLQTTVEVNANQQNIFIATTNNQKNPKFMKPITTIQEISDESGSDSSISKNNSSPQQQSSSSQGIEDEDQNEIQPQLGQINQTRRYISQEILVDDEFFATQKEIKASNQKQKTQNLKEQLKMNDKDNIKVHRKVKLSPNDLVIVMQQINNRFDGSPNAKQTPILIEQSDSDIYKSKTELNKELKKQKNQSCSMELPTLKTPFSKTFLPVPPASTQFEIAQLPYEKPPPKITRGLSMVEEWRKEEQDTISERVYDERSAAATTSKKQLNFGIDISFQNNFDELGITQNKKTLTSTSFGAKNINKRQKVKESRTLNDLISAVNHLGLDPIDDTKEDRHEDE